MDDRILPGEAILLLLWFTAPAFVLACALEAWLFVRTPMRRRAWQLAICLAVTGIAGTLLTDGLIAWSPPLRDLGSLMVFPGAVLAFVLAALFPSLWLVAARRASV